MNGHICICCFALIAGLSACGPTVLRADFERDAAAYPHDRSLPGPPMGDSSRGHSMLPGELVVGTTLHGSTQSLLLTNSPEHPYVVEQKVNIFDSKMFDISNDKVTFRANLSFFCQSEEDEEEAVSIEPLLVWTSVAHAGLNLGHRFQFKGNDVLDGDGELIGTFPDCGRSYPLTLVFDLRQRSYAFLFGSFSTSGALRVARENRSIPASDWVARFALVMDHPMEGAKTTYIVDDIVAIADREEEDDQ